MAEYDMPNNEQNIEQASYEEDDVNESSMYYVFIVGLAGIMVTAQSASLIKDNAFVCVVERGYCDYAVALGVISTLIALSIFGLTYTKNMTPEIKKPITAMLFMWNGVGVGVTTFAYPFAEMGITPNGYFGVWVALVTSAALVASVIAPTKINEKTLALRQKIRETWDRFQESTMLMLLVLGSVVCLVVAAIQCNDTDCSKISAFGVAFGAVNCISSGAAFYLHKSNPFQYSQTPSIIFHVNSFWWVCGFLSLTLSVNKFSLLGNGYLSILVGAIAAVNLSAVAQKKGASGNSEDQGKTYHEGNHDV